jgi:hypothetical protein
MLPPVAAVLPVEKLNETLVKLGLLPCCRFSRLLSINMTFLAILCGFGSLRLIRFPQLFNRRRGEPEGTAPRSRR